MATYQDIEIERGATWEREWTIVDENGDAADLTGCTAEMEIKRSANDATVLLRLSTADSSLTILAATGVIVGRIEAADTGALTWRSAVYDLLLTDGADVWRVVEGAVSISAGVTEL